MKKEVIELIAKIDTRIKAFLVAEALLVSAFIVSVKYLPQNVIVWSLTAIILTCLLIIVFIACDAKNRLTDRKSGKTRNTEKVGYVGYFYSENDGFERILIRVINNTFWEFSIRGTIPTQKNATQVVNQSLANWISKNSLIERSIYESGFYSPEIITIYDDESLKDTQAQPNIIKYLVKIRVEKEFDVISGDGNVVYEWKLKLPLFSNSKKQIIYPNKDTELDLSLIKKDKILRELNGNVLECVDILVFRENPNGDLEFLLLHRIDHSNMDQGWEYPKGGLEIHENLFEGGVRELLEETGSSSIGNFRFGGYIGVQSPRVVRKGKLYNALRVHGITYLFVGEKNDIVEFVKSGSQEHNNVKWAPLEEAINSIWMKEYSYGANFFERWRLNEHDIMQNVARPVSLAFQITEKCDHTCIYCLRRIDKEEPLSVEEIKSLINDLASRRILLLTFTGGEPLIYGKDKLFELIEHANKKKIHTTLSTTGITKTNESLNQNDVIKLDKYLDHLLISLDCLSESTAKKMYSSVADWKDMFNKASELIKWTKDTSIIVEVCTVVTKQNLSEIIDVGKWLFEKNTGIYWKIDEYYFNGPIQKVGETASKRTDFELIATDFTKLMSQIKKDPILGKIFSEQKIRFNTKESRSIAPDVMITPQGNLVTSSNNSYEIVGDKKAIKYWHFNNRRSFKEYRDYCRSWEWDTRLVM